MAMNIYALDVCLFAQATQREATKTEHQLKPKIKS
jgi:hypothetical protein